MLDDARITDPAAMADAPDAAGCWRIWPGAGNPPGSEQWDWSERLAPVPWMARPRIYARNVVVPSLALHRPPAGRANGTSMIVAPGGAFHFLMMEHEGHDMARWLNGLGITAFVLKYRLIRTPDDDRAMLHVRDDMQEKLGEPEQDTITPPEREFLADVRLLSEEDGRQAVRFVRQHAAELGVAANRIGICGYSAGGGVAMGAAMQFDARSRPDYAVGIYPAWPGQLSVPVNAPPLFLAISDDDRAVAPMSASRLYEAWHKTGASAELHVFANGGHGWGMDRGGHLADIWTQLLANWLQHHRLV